MLTVEAISRRDENLLMYIVAYLPPFFALDLTQWGQFTATLLFYVIFAWTYVELDMYYLNPMFVLRGFRTFTLISDTKEEYVALIKADAVPEVGRMVSYRGRDHVLLIKNK